MNQEQKWLKLGKRTHTPLFTIWWKNASSDALIDGWKMKNGLVMSSTWGINRLWCELLNHSIYECETIDWNVGTSNFKGCEYGMVVYDDEWLNNLVESSC